MDKMEEALSSLNDNPHFYLNMSILYLSKMVLNVMSANIPIGQSVDAIHKLLLMTEDKLDNGQKTVINLVLDATRAYLDNYADNIELVTSRIKAAQMILPQDNITKENLEKMSALADNVKEYYKSVADEADTFGSKTDVG